MNSDFKGHPTKDQLLSLSLGKLTPDAAEEVAQHVDSCHECSETIVNLQDDTFVSLVSNSPAPAPVDEAELRAADSQPAQHDVTVDIGSGLSGEEKVTPAELPTELRDHPRYEILELIGHGGMGDVYKAQHKVMNRIVALKVIKPELVKNDAAVGRFRREVQAAASLRHPNIVTAFDAEQAGDLHYLVMEYVDGENLDEVVTRSGRVSVHDACDTIHQAAEGLQHAHDLGMVHRDIKPHNLMIEKQTRAVTGSATVVKILDFGLANLANEVAEEALESEEQQTTVDEDDPQDVSPGVSLVYQLTQMGTMMGTPDYIAPEQAQDAHTADIRADIYSLGCTFYTLLTGKAPFSEGSVLDKVQAHTHEDAPPLADFRHDVPPEVEAVLLKMMAKDPAERYQTPAEVAEALEPLVRRTSKSVEITAHASQPRRTWKSIAPLTAVATLFLVTIAAAIFYIVTDNGVVRVEVTDPSLKVTIAGQTITMDDGQKSLTIRAGEQKLIVRQEDSDFELVTDSFQLRRGKEIALKVDLLPGEVVVSKGGERFGAKQLPAGATPKNYEPSEFFELLAKYESVVRQTVERSHCRMSKPTTSRPGPEQFRLTAQVTGPEEGERMVLGNLEYSLRSWVETMKGRVTGGTSPEEERGNSRTVRYEADGRSGQVRVTMVRLTPAPAPEGDWEWRLEIEANEHLESPLTIALVEGGEWRINGQPVGSREFDRLLREAIADNPERVVNIDIVKGIHGVSHVDMLEKIARNAGAKHVTRPAWAGARSTPLPEHLRLGGNRDLPAAVSLTVALNEGGQQYVVDGRTVPAKEIVEVLRSFFTTNPNHELIVRAAQDEGVEQVKQFLALARKLGAKEVGWPEWLTANQIAQHEREVDHLVWMMEPQRAKRANQLVEVGLALGQFHETSGRFPPSLTELEGIGETARRPGFDAQGRPLLSWRVHLLPYLTENRLYEQFRLDEPWDSEHNKALLAKMPAVYKTTNDSSKTSLLAVVGQGTAYEGKQGLSFTGFRDGLGNTVYVVDAGSGKGVPWTKPEDLPFDAEDPIGAFGTPDFGDRFLALMADASVRSIPYDTAPESLRALFTRAGGDSFDPTTKRTTPLPSPGADEVTLVRRFKGHESPVYQIACSPDGQRAITLSEGVACFWDIVSGRLLNKSTLVGPGSKSASSRYEATVSPDGRYAVVRGATVTLWDMESHKFVKTLLEDPGSGDAFASVSFSPDGRLLSVSVSRSAPLPHRLRVFGTEDWNELYSVNGSRGGIFSPDSRWVFTGRGKDIALLDASNGQLVRTLSGLSGVPVYGFFSSDGSLLAAEDATYKSPHVWETATGKLLTPWSADEGAGILAIFANKKRVLTNYHGSAEQAVRDLKTGKVLVRLQGHRGRIHTTCMLPDERHVITGSFDETIRIWNLTTGKEVFRVDTPGWSGTNLSVSPDGRSLLSGGGYLSVPRGELKAESFDLRLWRLPESVWPEEQKDELKPISQLDGHADAVADVAWHPDGKRAVSIGTDGEVRMWEVAGGKTLWTTKVDAEQEPKKRFAYSAVAVSPDGKLVAVGAETGLIYLLDAETGEQRKKWQSGLKQGLASWGIAALEFTPSGDWLAAVGVEGSPASVWDVKTGKQIPTRSDAEEAGDVAFTPDGRTMVTPVDRVFHSRGIGPDDNGVKGFVGSSGSEFDLEFTCVAVAPDGIIAFAGNKRGEVYTIRRDEGRTTFGAGSPHPQVAHQKSMWAMTVTPDGRHLITTGVSHPPGEPDQRYYSLSVWQIGPEKKTPRSWQPPKLTRLFEERSQTAKFGSIALSPDGRTLLSTGGIELVERGPQPIHVWRLPESVWPEEPPKELSLEQTLKGHSGLGVSTASLAATPDGKLLISAGGKDKTARLWDVERGETLFVMPMENDGPVSVAITADGKRAAVRGTNGHIDLWDIVEKKKIRSLDQTEVRRGAMAFSTTASG